MAVDKKIRVMKTPSNTYVIQSEDYKKVVEVTDYETVAAIVLKYLESEEK